MKIKTKSAAKKRIKVRKSGSIKAKKPCMNHLLSNKSKTTRKPHMNGFEIDSSHKKMLRRVMPGQIPIK